MEKLRSSQMAYIDATIANDIELIRHYKQQLLKIAVYTRKACPICSALLSMSNVAYLAIDANNRQSELVLCVECLDSLQQCRTINRLDDFEIETIDSRDLNLL